MAAGQDAKSPSSESRSLIKQLLSSLAEDIPSLCSPCIWQRLAPSERSIYIYKFFLQKCVHFDTDLSIASSVDDDILQGLFGLPDEEPVYMTFHAGGADLAKLSGILKIDLVVYFNPARQRRTQKYKWFDSRLQSQLTGSGNSQSTYFFRVERCKAGEFTLNRVNEGEALKEYTASESESPFISGRSVMTSSFNSCYLGALLALLGARHKPEHDDPCCPTLLSLCLAMGRGLGQTTMFFLKRKRILLASHHSTGCRYKYARKKTNGKGALGILDPKNQVFRILATLTGQGDVAETIVVCVTVEGRLYIPHKLYADRAREGHKFPAPNTLNPLRIDRLVQKKSAGSTQFPEKDREQGKKQKTAPYEPACPCSLCSNGLDYYKNFVIKGDGRRRPTMAQRPFRSELDTLEYLHCFGIDTQDIRKRLTQVWSLSFASMDVESMTETLPAHTSDETAKIENLTELRYDSSPRLRQSVVVFAHGDFMNPSGTEEVGDCTPAFFRVKKNKSLVQLSVEYLDYIRKRRDAAAQLKEKLLEPVFSVLKPLKEAHWEYCRQRRLDGESDKTLKARTESSFSTTLMGKFESHLARLVRSYYIFAYNGKGYDFILMAGPLVSAAARLSPPARPRIMREGNQVRSIRIEKGIVFRDLCCLSGHGVSLAQLAKMSGIPQEKSYFPFKQLSSLESLQDPELSADPSMWASELGGRSATDSDILEARRLFQERGMTSLGDWLDFYLGRDILCLLLCTKTLFNRFFSLLGCHPIDVGKLTIASYSSYVVQLFLFKEARPALYSPMTTSLYSSLRDTTKGGLVQVSRHHCDVGNKDPASRINAHLVSLLQGDGKQGHDYHETTENVSANPRHAKLNKIIDAVLDEFGENMLPSQRATQTPTVPGLSASRPAEAAHAAVVTTAKIFQPPEGFNEKKPLGRPVDFLKKHSENGGASWLLTERERREGAQPPNYSFYLDEHGTISFFCFILFS